MRILYCNKYNYRFSGTEVYLFEIMDLMRAQGHEVALFSMSDERGEPTPYDEFFLPAIDFKTHSQGMFEKASLAAHAIYSGEARARLRQMIAAFQPDVAHVRNIYHHLSPSILWELHDQGVPVLYHINDFKMLCPSYNMVAHGKPCQRCRGGAFRHVVTEDCYAGTLGAKLLLAAEAYVHDWAGTYRKCVDRFLAPSQFVKAKLLESGCQAGTIDVLPHFQRIRPHTPSISPHSPILYFGRLSPEKGVADLIQSLRNLPHIKLQIAGDGPSRAQLQQLTQALRMQNVEFLGHVERPKLDQLIAASRFTVLPSLAYETFAKSILESYAWSRAVIASDLGSRRELVNPGCSGLLYPPGNIDQLSSTIAYLYERPALATEMGAAGLRIVRDNHRPETHYSELLKIYRRLTNSSPPRPTRARDERSSSLSVAFIGGRGVAAKYSGIETYYEEVGKRLAEMGHRVTVYCRSHFTPPTKMHNGMRVVRLPALRSKHLETVVHTILSTIHAMFGSHDIVHYHCLGPALFSFLPRLAGKKTVVTVQGLDWRRKKWGKVAAHILRWGELASLRFPNSTMVVSRTLQNHFRRQHFAETSYVPNGTGLRGLRQPDHILKLGLEPRNYILFLGRFSPEKNCDLLIAAYEKLDTHAQLVLAGGSSHTDAYADKIRRHASDRVRILDWVSGDLLDELLTNAMLFVLPSDLEGLSLALLDAMGAGVCALASAIPENLELLGEGAGFTFKPGDACDLARMLETLISQPRLREGAAAKAREVVQERYQWSQVVDEVEKIYCTTLAGNRPVSTKIPVLPMPPATSERPPRAA